MPCFVFYLFIHRTVGKFSTGNLCCVTQKLIEPVGYGIHLLYNLLRIVRSPFLYKYSSTQVNFAVLPMYLIGSFRFYMHIKKPLLAIVVIEKLCFFISEMTNFYSQWQYLQLESVYIFNVFVYFRDIINKKHSWEFRARASEVYDFAAT